MNALVLAEHFRAAFAADAAFNGRQCHNDQSADALARPSLIFAVSTKSFSQDGRAFSFTLTVWVEDQGERKNPGDADPALAHATAVSLVNQKLFGIPGLADSEVITGAPTPRGTALLAALNAEAIHSLRGWSATDSDPGLETHHFRTPVALVGTALQL